MRDIKKEVKQETIVLQPKEKPKKKKLKPTMCSGTRCKPFSICLERLEIPDIEFKLNQSANQKNDHDQLEISQQGRQDISKLNTITTTMTSRIHPNTAKRLL